MITEYECLKKMQMLLKKYNILKILTDFQDFGRKEINYPDSTLIIHLNIK